MGWWCGEVDREGGPLARWPLGARRTPYSSCGRVEEGQRKQFGAMAGPEGQLADVLAQAVSVLHGTQDLEQRKSANEWLNGFAKTREAWNTSLDLVGVNNGHAREATSLSLSLFWRALKPQTSKENGAAPALNLRRESSRWVCECFEKRPLNSSSSAHAHARDSSTCLPLWLRKGSAQPAHPQSP